MFGGIAAIRRASFAASASRRPSFSAALEAGRVASMASVSFVGFPLRCRSIESRQMPVGKTHAFTEGPRYSRNEFLFLVTAFLNDARIDTHAFEFADETSACLPGLLGGEGIVTAAATENQRSIDHDDFAGFSLETARFQSAREPILKAGGNSLMSTCGRDPP